MKRLFYIIFLLLITACSDSSYNNTDSLINDEQAYKFVTITNGANKANLYLAGMIGISPGQTSDTIKIYNNKKDLLYKWSNKDYSKTIWDTLHINLSNLSKYKGENIILKDE
jgi:hypothetical protein